MRRLGGGRKFWGKRRINRIYSQHSRKPENYERTVYGVLLMVVIEASSGKVVDIWFHPASFHEKRSLRIRVFKSPYLRELLKGRILRDIPLKLCKGGMVWEGEEGGRRGTKKR